MAAEPQGSKDATPPTCAHNRSFLDALPFGDRADFEDAARGFIGTLPKVEFRNAEGRVIFSLEDYAFLAHEQAPDTVNPSLWRQARLNMNNGLFQVTDRIYQVRGFDISNMTIIEGSRGLIVIDPLVSTEVARAGIELYFQHRGRKPVTAVIYSHSHVDHFGGVRGVIDEAEREGRQRRHHRSGQIHGGGDQGERSGRHADAPPRHVPVRRPAAQGPARRRSMPVSARSSRAAPSR